MRIGQYRCFLYSVALQKMVNLLADTTFSYGLFRIGAAVALTMKLRNRANNKSAISAGRFHVVIHAGRR